jgi:hypothetical protein
LADRGSDLVLSIKKRFFEQNTRCALVRQGLVAIKYIATNQEGKTSQETSA